MNKLKDYYWGDQKILVCTIFISLFFALVTLAIILELQTYPFFIGNRLSILILAMGVSWLLSIVTIFLVSQFEDFINTRAELENFLFIKNLKVLGSISDRKNEPNFPIIYDLNSVNLYDYKQVISKLKIDYSSTKVIAVIGLGNPQKNIFVYNLGISQAYLKKRTLIVEADTNSDSSYKWVEATPKNPSSLGSSRWKDKISRLYRPCAIENLFVIPKYSFFSWCTKLEENCWLELIEGFKNIFDLVIIDSSSLKDWEDNFYRINSIGDRSIVTAKLGMLRFSTSRQMIDSWQKVGAKISGVVIIE